MYLPYVVSVFDYNGKFLFTTYGSRDTTTTYIEKRLKKLKKAKKQKKTKKNK